MHMHTIFEYMVIALLSNCVLCSNNRNLYDWTSFLNWETIIWQIKILTPSPLTSFFLSFQPHHRVFLSGWRLISCHGNFCNLVRLLWQSTGQSMLHCEFIPMQEASTANVQWILFALQAWWCHNDNKSNAL